MNHFSDNYINPFLNFNIFHKFYKNLFDIKLEMKPAYQCYYFLEKALKGRNSQGLTDAKLILLNDSMKSILTHI